MASVYPAMKGKFGSTDYFMLTMKANDVAQQLVIPKEIPGWEDLQLEERFQREINYNRVKKQIAPYLANDPNRFFGALIVDVINPEEITFEGTEKILKDIPNLYQTPAKSFGFLTLSGGEMLVPLDGQHRLAAIQFALSGKDEKQRPIEGIDPNTELANDDVLLIMIKHDSDKGRKIFNKVNRYAKATTKSENLITADDDIIATITRETIANGLIGSRLVNYQSNTLPDSAHYFTTLSTIYEATKHILEEQHGRINIQTLPDEANRRLYKSTAKVYWEHLLGGVTIYQKALENKSEEGDEGRRDIRKAFLLGKPIAQLALMLAVIRLNNSEQSDGSRLSWETILERINAVDWGSDNPMWQNILMQGSRIVSGKQAAGFASRFIAYYLGENLEETELNNLKEVYASHFPEAERSKVSLEKRLFNP